MTAHAEDLSVYTEQELVVDIGILDHVHWLLEEAGKRDMPILSSMTTKWRARARTATARAALATGAAAAVRNAHNALVQALDALRSTGGAGLAAAPRSHR